MKVHEQHKKKGPKVVNIALVIVSTSRYNEIQDGTESSDKTVPLVTQILEENSGVSLNIVEIVSDDKGQIKNMLNELLKDDAIHSIIFSGGTGLDVEDITYEIIQPLLEKEITGFGEIFRSLSYEEIGAAAMLSRATGGRIKDKSVFILPGSPKAVELALKKLIIPEIRHITYMITKEE